MQPLECASGDSQRPDPISGYVLANPAPYKPVDSSLVDPAFIATVFQPQYSEDASKWRRFDQLDELKGILSAIDSTPVMDTHKVGIIYVSPGQTTEKEILSNLFGSPAYSRFLTDLGRVIKPSRHLEVYTGGLDPARHGEYAYAWWDDMSQIIYHVATLMPNIDRCMHKKAEIGNDGVKIVWNDGGTPFKFDTIHSEFSLINVIVEPHSIGSRAAFSDNKHENEFFKVTLQTAPGLPRVTPIGEFKIVSADKLSIVLRHFTLLASFFCNAWVETGRDSDFRIPLQTNWQQRLRYITNAEQYLSKDPQAELRQRLATGINTF